jgi:hypothetical protein
MLANTLYEGRGLEIVGVKLDVLLRSRHTLAVAGYDTSRRFRGSTVTSLIGAKQGAAPHECLIDTSQLPHA